MGAGRTLSGQSKSMGGLTGQVTGAGSGSAPYQIGSGLKLVENVLSVDVADTVEKDNSKPVTSGAVYMELGNVEALLANL